MNRDIDLSDLLRTLESKDIAEQVGAVEALASAVETVGCLVVDAFVRSSNRLVIAERLYRFGQFVVKPLSDTVASSDCEEVRILGSLVLLQLGSHAGLEHLLAAISHGGEYLCLVALRLADAEITQAGNLILSRLRALSASNVDEVVCLMTALEKLRIALPEDLRERFSAPGTPFQIRLSFAAKA